MSWWPFPKRTSTCSWVRWAWMSDLAIGSMVFMAPPLSRAARAGAPAPASRGTRSPSSRDRLRNCTVPSCSFIPSDSSVGCRNTTMIALFSLVAMLISLRTLRDSMASGLMNTTNSRQRGQRPADLLGPLVAGLDPFVVPDPEAAVRDLPDDPEHVAHVPVRVAGEEVGPGARYAWNGGLTTAFRGAISLDRREGRFAAALDRPTVGAGFLRGAGAARRRGVFREGFRATLRGAVRRGARRGPFPGRFPSACDGWPASG